MKTIELLELLTTHATNYREIAKQSVMRNAHMNNLTFDDTIQQPHVDAILTDFINYVAANMGVDYGLYTEDLTNPHKNPTPQCH